jgi:hypothetical protein
MWMRVDILALLPVRMPTTNSLLSTLSTTSPSTILETPISTSAQTWTALTSKETISTSILSSSIPTTPNLDQVGSSNNKKYGTPEIIGTVLGVLGLIVAIFTFVVNWKVMVAQLGKIRKRPQAGPLEIYRGRR